eukprot:TRINITY_DN3402_c0_g3_i1.p1 TRINITY_DN3402_c0_g3~~TRINITY_DN3402_c0_g3_i1.p1  ORF type:complete len:144 (-),score=20.79 TRINITY_DN3402_c0_g3_i1:87-518(-)
MSLHEVFPDVSTDLLDYFLGLARGDAIEAADLIIRSYDFEVKPNPFPNQSTSTSNHSTVRSRRLQDASVLRLQFSTHRDCFQHVNEEVSVYQSDGSWNKFHFSTPAAWRDRSWSHYQNRQKDVIKRLYDVDRTSKSFRQNQEC